jgi:hypothetical protein
MDAMKLPRVTKANLDRGFRIRVSFSDRTSKVVDFRPWLRGPIFEPLKDERYFARFVVDGGTVAWPNGADIAPETLYAARDVADSKAVSRPAHRTKSRLTKATAQS